MIDRRASPELTPERLRAIKAGRDPNHEVPTANGGTPGAARFLMRGFDTDPAMISPRWANAVARIYRIGEGAKASSFGRATETAECPKLAKEYLETYAYFMMRTAPAPIGKTDHNPFRHLSNRDAMRKFVRMVEDICDRSTGKLGAWCTK